MTLTIRIFRELALPAVLVLAVGVSRAAERGPAGVVSHLNLVSDKSEDVSSLEAWKATYIKPGMSEQEKTLAIFKTLLRYRHQAYPPQEYLGSGQTGGHVHDPLCTIHVYGYGQCCCAASEVCALARYLGLQARGRNLSLHSVPEIYYDGGWHLADASVMNCHFKPDGRLASVDEIHEAVAGWLKQHRDLAGNDNKLRAFARDFGWKKGPALLAGADLYYGKNGVNSAGWHGWPSTMQEYARVEPNPFEFGSTLGYQLNVQLRPGERITRNFFSRGPEFTNGCSAAFLEEMKDRKLLGLQTKLGDRAPRRVGDGTVEWTVPLVPDTLRTCALTADNLAAAGQGIAPADAARPGVLVLRFPCSYVYVKGQAVFKAAVGSGGSLVVRYSDNNGLDWTEVARRVEESGEQTLDLTPLIRRRYDFRLQFELNGAGTRVDALRTSADFQLSQAALPTITEGENVLTFRAGPAEGTVTMEGNTSKAQAQKHQQLALADFHPTVLGMNGELCLTAGRGSITFPICAPGDITRLRLSAFWRARDARDGFDVEVSFDGGKTYQPVPGGKLPGGTTGNTRYLVVDNVPPGTREAHVRFAGRQVNTACLFDLRLGADYREPNGGFRPVRITYAWEEDGQPRTDTHVATRPEETYTIRCGPKTVVRSYTMELAP